MMVRQKVGRYAGRVFDMPIMQAIANVKSGSVEFAEAVPETARLRLEEAGLIEAQPKPVAVKRGPGRPRAQKNSVPATL